MQPIPIVARIAGIETAAVLQLHSNRTADEDANVGYAHDFSGVEPGSREDSHPTHRYGALSQVKFTLILVLTLIPIAAVNAPSLRLAEAVDRVLGQVLRGSSSSSGRMRRGLPRHGRPRRMRRYRLQQNGSDLQEQQRGHPRHQCDCGPRRHEHSAGLLLALPLLLLSPT